MGLPKSKISLRILLLFLLMVVVGGVAWSWYRGRTDQLWQRVQTAHAEGRHETAAIALKSLLQKSPNFAPAHRFLADVLLTQAMQKNPSASFGNFKPAYRELAIAYKLGPQNRNFAEDFMQAEYERDSFTSAIKIAKELLEKNTNNNHARRILAEIALKKEDFASAEKYIAPISRHSILNSIPLISIELKILKSRQNEKEMQVLYERCLKNSLKTNETLSFRKRSKLNQIVHSAVIDAPNVEVAQQRLVVALDYFERYGKIGSIGDAALKTVNLVGALHNRFPKHEMFSPEQFKKSSQRIDRMIARAVENRNVKSWFYRNSAELKLFLHQNHRALAIARQGIENLSQAKWKNRFDEEISKLHLLLARRLVSTGKFRSAEPHLEKLLKDARYAAIGHRLAGIVAQHEARYSEAFAHFEKARKGLKNSLPLRLELAETCMSLKKWNQALPYLHSLHIDRGNLQDEQKEWAEKNLGDGFRIHLQEALCYLSLEQFEKMKNEIDLLRGSRFEPQIAMLEAYALLRQGKSNEAIAHLKASRKLHPRNNRITQLLAKILDSLNRTVSADRIVDEYEKQNSENLSVLAFACLRSLERNHHDKAERQLELLTQNFPQSPVVWYLKSREALDRKDAKEAAIWSEKLAKHSGTESLGTALSTLMELKNRNLDHAVELLESNTAEHESGIIDLLQSEVQFQKGNYDEALESLTSAMRFNSWRKKSSAVIFRSLSKLLRKSDSKQVLKKIDTLIAKYPHESLLYLTKTDLHLRQADYASAMTTLEKLQQTHPKATALMLLKARIYESVNQHTPALREINRALTIDANSIPSRLLGAQICLKSSRFDAAREYLVKNIAYNKNPALQLMLASVESRQGKETQANDRLLKLIENNPRIVSAYFLLSNTMKGKPHRWETVLRNGLKARPHLWFLHHELFALLKKTNRKIELDKAITEFDAKNSTFSTSLRIAGFFFETADDFKTQKWIEIAKKRAKSPRQQSRIFALKAEIAIRENRKDRGKLKKLIDARRFLKKSLELNPQNLQSSERLISLLAGDFREKKEAFRIAELLVKKVGLQRLSKNTVRFMLDYYLANDSSKLRSFIDRLIEKRSHETEWIYAKVERAIAEHKVDKALAEVRLIAEKQRWKPEPWLAIARLHEARNEDSQAMNALFTAVKLQPQHVPSRLMLIDFCQKAGLDKQVIIHSKAVLSKHPQMWSLYEKQLAAFRNLGYKTEAERIADNLSQKLGAAIRKNPHDLRAHRAFVNLNLHRNDLPAALSAVQFARKNLPESKPLRYDEIQILLRLKRTAEGLDLVKIGFSKANATDCLALARIFLNQKMFSKAYAWSKKGYAFKKGLLQNKFCELLGEICFHRGIDTGEKKWFQEAVGCYRKLLTQNPDHWEALNNLCWILSDRLDHLSEALALAEDFRRKHTIRELDIEFIDTLASIYRKSFAYERNKDFLEEAIRLHPHHAGIRFELAMSYLELGKSIQGIRLLSSAMSLGLEGERQQIAQRFLAVPVKTNE